MEDNQGEFVLGDDVTSLARSRLRKGSVVLSVRLSAEELAAVDALASENGKTPSQIVREAIRDYVHGSRAVVPTVTISLVGGSTLATGAVSIVTRAASAVNYHPREIVVV